MGKNRGGNAASDLKILERVKALAEPLKNEKNEMGKIARKTLAACRRIERAEKLSLKMEKAQQERNEKELDQLLERLISQKNRWSRSPMSKRGSLGHCPRIAKEGGEKG